MSKAYISFKEKVAIREHLASLLEPVSADKSEWRYINGMTEAEVAEQLKPKIPGITVYHVRGIRQECFGFLRAIRVNGANNNCGALAARVETLATEITVLMAERGRADAALQRANRAVSLADTLTKRLDLLLARLGEGEPDGKP